METKQIIIALVLLIVIVGGLIFLTINQTIKLSPDNSKLEECKPLIDNGNNKINIVFFSEEEEAQKFIQPFLQTQPFAENKDAFNFYYINTYFPQCELYKGVALLCYTKELIKKSASCPNDYIIVIEDQPANIRSTAYMNVMSLNLKSSPNVFAHEFGHAFANLADEYTPSKIPKKSKNCAQSCDEFEQKDGCYQGCSEDNYYRSIEAGVMKTLSTSNYGLLNSKLILDKINEKLQENSKITGNVIEDDTCTENEYYLIQGLYSENEIEILEETLEQGCIGENGAGDLEYNLIFEDDSISSTNEFNPEFIFTDTQGENEIDGETLTSDKEFFLRIPKIASATSLEISENGTILSTINLKDIGSRPCKNE
jgi:hypothetical protein